MGVWSESLRKYGSTIIKSFLGTTLTTIFGVNTLSKHSVIICQWSHSYQWGNFLYAKYFLIYLIPDGIS